LGGQKNSYAAQIIMNEGRLHYGVLRTKIKGGRFQGVPSLIYR